MARRADKDLLTGLFELSQALTSAPDLRAALHRALARLEEHHDVAQAAVFVLDPESGEITVEAAVGTGAEDPRATYALGEGITGKVIESARPIVVPEVSKEPLSQKARRRTKELSLICVPIGPGAAKKASGALSISLPFAKDRDYEAALRFFQVASAMIGQALAADRQVQKERRKLLEENSSLRLELRERYDLFNIIGTGGAMRQVYEQIAQVAPVQTTVLIRGESGTGKELIAHAIHYNSPRAKKPFIKVSCAALPDTLIESELFGYEKGAFTGAVARKKGRFEAADGGTLFLDEIGDINPQTQIKLLRVLQEREFERLGGTEPVRANVRLIAATNKDLEAAIAEKSFRADLYYRLAVFSIFVPPLRDRKSDVTLLSDHFLAKYARQHGKDIKRISTPAIDMLSSYHWPGNVRELENIIERAVLVADGQVIHGHHLPPTLQTAEASDTVTRSSLIEAVDRFEKDLIVDALKSTRGNRAKAARLLRTTERILGYKAEKHGIDSDRFKR